ncbi:PEGA domain-containing protein [Candidatus Symbiothrix dinenymphae]|uniref:PEGA domain-containing protein n=1 Tax=Candidatus Symbiothrix dinenymphae TaxID=467085 RepID=UPI0013155603|nr:PEGA domain-containing protein [Candidatus Symbiothrix dinenymphae]
MDESDQEARMRSPRKDQNDKVCAIIKIETTLLLQDFSFDAGMVAVTATEQKIGEIWVYLSPGARRLTIQHKDLGSVRNYEFGESLKEATVYIMKLKSGTVERVMKENVALQYLIVNCPIEGATIKLDGNPSEAFSNGTFQKLLSYGKHQYTIEAPMYYPLNGQIEIRASEKSSLTPDLKPAFAVITLTGDGDIYVNDERKGAGRWSERLMPGSYKVEVKKALHRPSVSSFEVKAGENKTIPLQAPAPIYGSLNISANVVDATIFIDGVKHKDNAPTIIKEVLIGKHTIELQAKGCKPDKQTVEVQEGKIAEIKAQLDKIVLANLQITSTPSSTVSINGARIGSTPTTKEDLPLGQTFVSFEASGYERLEKTMNLTAGHNEIHGKLKKEIKTFVWLEYLYSGTAPLGFTIGGCGKWGGYIRFKTDVHFDGAPSDDGADIDFSNIDFDKREYYRLAWTAGLMARLFKGCYLYGGAGYGKYGAAYQIVDTENYYCPDLQKGLDVEGGMVLHLGPIALSAGYNTLLLSGSKQRLSDVSVGVAIALMSK